MPLPKAFYICQPDRLGTSKLSDMSCFEICSACFNAARLIHIGSLALCAPEQPWPCPWRCWTAVLHRIERRRPHISFPRNSIGVARLIAGSSICQADECGCNLFLSISADDYVHVMLEVHDQSRAGKSSMHTFS